MFPRRWLPACLCAFVLCPSLLPAAPEPSIAFSPREWKYGMIAQGTKIQTTVTVTNLQSRAVTVRFVATCSCLEATPPALTIGAGADGAFSLSYDSIDDKGITERSFLVTTDVPGAPAQHYWLRGTVRQQEAAPAEGGTRVRPGTEALPDQAGTTVVSYYYTPGCRSCEEFLSVEIPRLEKRLGLRIEVQKKDLLAASQYEELARIAASRGGTVTAIPVLRVGDTLLQGDKEIRQKLPQALSALAPGTETAAAPGLPPVTERLAVLPVVVAGLIDGINPCAFTTIIFLLASLALAGRGRREILLIGALFSFAVFLTYFLVGLGFFTALRAAASVSVVSAALRWVLVAVLLVFTGLSVYDYTLIRAGRPREMLLQLPTGLKKRIHASIRTRVRVATLAGSSLVLGFLVSLFEFACTGQVYLPLLGYMARMRRQPDALGLLALYNLCFILPLLVVFGASYLGVSSGRITGVFQAHMGKVKLGLAVVFAGLAVFTLVG